MGEQYVSLREFDRYREGVDKELARLRRDLDEAVKAHDEDAKAERESKRRDREWTWTRLIGIVMAAVALAALELQYLASHK